MAENDPLLTNASQTELEQSEILDRYVAAIQSGNSQLSEMLLSEFPYLSEWTECCGLLDVLAGDLLASRPDQAAADNSTEEHLIFGKYELLEEIGRGGMGVVYKARQRGLNRIVAIKMILSNHLATVEEVKRFQVEARAAARLRHPGIIGIHEIDVCDGQHFFVMDYVSGESLSGRLAQGPMAPEEAGRLLIQIAQAVDHLHSQGVIHRDLKPSNILLDHTGAPLLTDFGLAKVFDSSGSQTRTGMIIGTPSYMSPEQASGRTAAISTKSDVYGLGAILYEMLTGKPPFREETPLDTLVQVLEGEPAPPCRLNPMIPRDLELICLKCLEKAPEQRYATANELVQDLLLFFASEPVHARSGWKHSLRRWLRRQPNLACHWGALFLAMLILHVRYALALDDPHLQSILMSILVTWAGLCWVWQWLLDQDIQPDLVRFGGIVTDNVLLTTALAVTTRPVAMLIVLYPLLIVASGLSFREKHVWQTVGCSLLAFVVLMASKPELMTPWHDPLLVVVVLIVLGSGTAYQVRRVRALSRFYEGRPFL